jgi:hypothetical protein
VELDRISGYWIFGDQLGMVEYAGQPEAPLERDMLLVGYYLVGVWIRRVDAVRQWPYWEPLMVKRKYEYIEGRKARENFEQAMTAAFQVPKEQVPRPQPKKRKAKPKPHGKD